MGVFYLKYRDTRPALEVALKNPDGTAYDLTGCGVALHIELSGGTKLTRSMVVYGTPTNGIARYTWLASDWDNGGLVVSPSLPLAAGTHDHRMEYEVTNGTARLTFPNDGSNEKRSYDTLRITQDLGQS